MPLKIKCDCGQVLSVPESAAGKAVKCPKCQKAVRVPAASPAAASGTPAKAAVAAKPAASKAAMAPSNPTTAAKPTVRAAAASTAKSMDDLYDEAGLKKKTGNVCPKCGASITKLAALCTKCGFNLQSGEQLQGFEVKVEEEEFKNEFLQEAANNMFREDLAGERHAKAGMPWWMVLAFLMGALSIGAAGVLIVDKFTNEPQPESTFIGKVQKQSIGVVIGTTFILMAVFMSTLANLSILIFAFQQSIGRGFACMFIPLYIFIYGCITWIDNKAAIKGILLAAVIGGFGAYLYFANGGIK